MRVAPGGWLVLNLAAADAGRRSRHVAHRAKLTMHRMMLLIGR
jgi:hypothetical protein